MARKRNNAAIKLTLIGAAVAALLYAFPNGPPPGVSGAPGEGTCANCHFQGSLGGNGGGQVEIAFPAGMTYSPGAKQQWTITITDADALRYGFQLSARLAQDNSQAGTLSPAPGESSNIRVICSNGAPRGDAGCPASAPIEYIEHSSPRQTNTFDVEWTPPTTAADAVRIYVAANAANGNGRQTGDDIYTANYTLTPQPGGTAPTISQGGVVNAWSFKNPIGDASWVAIFGSGLAPTTRQWRADEIVGGKLPTNLDGVSVKVNNKETYVYFISPGQVNVQVPNDGATGPVPVQVTTPNGASNVVMVDKQVTAPGLFTWAGLAQGAERFVGAVAAQPRPDGKLDFIAPAGLLPDLTARPAQPGETVLIFATGCGPTNPSFPAGQVVAAPVPALDSPVSVRIGGIPAQLAGNTGFLAFAGVCQFNVVVPPNAPNGNLPVVLDIAGVSTQTTQPDVNIAVQSPAALAAVHVSYRLDPWLIGGTYGGGFWVSPPVLGPTTQGGQSFALEARAQGTDAQRAPIVISPAWIPSDPSMVTVAPSQGGLVTITVHRSGQSTLQVTADGIARVLRVTAAHRDNVLFVEIAQQQ